MESALCRRVRALVVSNKVDVDECLSGCRMNEDVEMLKGAEEWRCVAWDVCGL